MSIYSRIAYWFDSQEKKVSAAYKGERNNTVERFFYPSYKGRVFSSADRWIFPAILLSLLFTSFDIIQNKGEVASDFESASIFVKLNLFLFFIFIIEYSFRLYLRGRVYAGSAFGIIDGLCIGFDALFFLLLLTKFPGNEEIAFYAKLLRVIRIFRLLRFFQYQTLIREKFYRLKPIVFGIVKSFALLLSIFVLVIFVVFSFQTDNATQSTIDFISGKVLQGDGYEKGSESIKEVRLLILTLLWLSFMNLYAAVFSPIATRIIESNKLRTERILRTNHIVIYASESESYLE